MTETFIEAKPTEYKGHTFRSRLEAKWAVLMDNLAIKWTYEEKAYSLPGTAGYLPDFHLPEMNAYLEIKGRDLVIPDEIKAQELAKNLNEPVFIGSWRNDNPAIIKAFTKSGSVMDGGVIVQNDVDGKYVLAFSLNQKYAVYNGHNIEIGVETMAADGSTESRTIAGAIRAAKYTRFEYCEMKPKGYETNTSEATPAKPEWNDMTLISFNAKKFGEDVTSKGIKITSIGPMVGKSFSYFTQSKNKSSNVRLGSLRHACDLLGIHTEDYIVKIEPHKTAPVTPQKQEPTSDNPLREMLEQSMRQALHEPVKQVLMQAIPTITDAIVDRIVCNWRK